MLGFLTALFGGMFILIGVNAAVRPSGPGEQRARIPVTGLGFGERRASPAVRRTVAAAWIVLGLLFMVAAFTHQVP